MTAGPTDGEEANFFERLRRRKVVQWGLAYVAGAWGFLQGLEYASEVFDWPGQLQRAATVALLVGLPVALTLAWYHGDRGQQRVSRIELTILTLLFVIGGGLFWRYQHAPEQAPIASTSPRPSTAATQATADDAGPSIAVLPFDNRSDEQKDAHFVDGIHDDILTQLSKVSALKVISRTSVEQFRDTRLPIKEIAQQLGVNSILEGGVQRGGDRVRINVQLIDAATDAHLWAETYDRALTAENIFAIQSEVAQSIAAALKAALTTDEKARVSTIPTRNLEAWEAYQLGRQRMQSRTSEALTDAERQFRKAVTLDPGFALGYVGLGDTVRLQHFYSGKPLEPALAEAEAAIATALELDPYLGEAWASQGGIASSRQQNEVAEQLLRRAIALNPNYATAHHWLSMQLRWKNQTEMEFVHAERAVQLDPLSVVMNLNFGDTLEKMGRLDEAAARYKKTLELDPTSSLAFANLAVFDAYSRNRFVDAVPLMERAIANDPGGVTYPSFLSVLWLDLNDEVQSKQAVGSALQRWPDSVQANEIAAMIRTALGDSADAERHTVKVLADDPRNLTSVIYLGNADLRRNDPQTARERYAAAFPELFVPRSPTVDPLNHEAAICLALVLQKLDATEQATALLDASEQTIRGGQRLGVNGYGIAEVQIHALRGDKTKALIALRDAEQAGWRGPLWRYYRDIDPNLDSIRSESEFENVFADIERDVERQRAELAARIKAAPLPPESSGT